ncbi:MAG TPA: Ig-like domain-containing protein [Gemmatimonadales bacterium]
MGRVGLRVALLAAGAALIASCLRDVGGPGAMRRARMALAPAFVSTGAAIVDFDRIRVTVERGTCGSADGGEPTTTRARAAVDTIVPFPAGVDSIELALVVPLEAPQEEFLVFVRLITAQGDTVFRNVPYPQCVVVVAGGPSAVLATLLEYVGLGANAASVVISSADSLVSFGGTLDLAATALDATGKPLPGTPVVWSSLDPLRVGVPDGTVPRVLGGSQRGPARIVAKLLTGPADTTLITAQPLPSVLAIVSGDGQTGVPGLPLPLPLRVRVTGADGLGVQVPVTFRPLIAGATVQDPVVLSDASGFAETEGILPVLTSLTAAFEASVAGLPPVLFSGLALTDVAQVIVTPGTAGLDLLGGTVQYAAQALDSSGTPLLATFSWSSSNGGVATVDPATGLVTAAGNGTTTITATAEGVSGNASFTLLQRVVQLVFTTLPSDAVAGVPIDPPVQVAALDPGGSVATNFTSAVTLSRSDLINCTGPLGTITVAAVAGVATFSDLSFQQACPGLQLQATADTMNSPVSSPFTVLPGAAAAISLVSGGGVTDTVRATLPTLLVRVSDQYGNGVPGYPVSWVVTGGDGSLALSATTSDTSGSSFADWTLGSLVGANSVEARAGPLNGSPVGFTATAIPGTATQLSFVVEPSEAVFLQIIAPPVEVAIRDQFGNAVPTWTTPVTMVIGRNPLGTGTLLGTTDVTPASGVAKFTDLSIDLVALGYTLLATSSPLPSQESKPFNITLLPTGPVFGGDSAAGLSSGVFRVSPDGSNRSLLSDRGWVGDVHPRWSSDRSRAAFTFVDQVGGPNGLFVVADTGGTPAIGQRSCGDPQPVRHRA